MKRHCGRCAADVQDVARARTGSAVDLPALDLLELLFDAAPPNCSINRVRTQWRWRPAGAFEHEWSTGEPRLISLLGSRRPGRCGPAGEENGWAS